MPFSWLTRLFRTNGRTSESVRESERSAGSHAAPDTVADHLLQARQARQQGDLITAERLLLPALSSKDERHRSDALFELASLQLERGKPEDALDCLETINGSSQFHLDALRLGIGISKQLGKWSLATEWMTRIARRDGAPLADWYSLARLMREGRRPGRGLELIDEGLRHYPDDVHLLIERGLTLRDLNRYAEAEADITRAHLSLPGDARGIHAYVTLLSETGRADEAAALAARFAAEEPDNLPAAVCHAGMLKATGRTTDAVAVYEEAARHFPDRAEPWISLTHMYFRLGDFERAASAGRHAVQLAPTEPAAHVNLAMNLLVCGHLKEGWEHYQWRYQGLIRKDYPMPVCPDNPLVRFPADLMPLDLHGRRITLIEDQGLGDELSFLRFAPLLRQRGAVVTYVPDARLASMIGRAAAVDHVTPPGEDAPTDTEIYLAPGDLPLILDVAEHSQIPPPLPLTVRTDMATAIDGRLAPLRRTGRPLVGVTWRAGISSSRGDRLYKAIAIEALAILLRDLPVEVLILQRAPQAGELEQFAAQLGRPVHDFSDLNADLEAMLALLDTLDDYVSVSNTNVHLRASLGRPARILVPSPPDYRWMASGDESPWFPNFRVYRQAVDSTWDKAFAALQRDLWLHCTGNPPPPEVVPVAWPTAPAPPLPRRDTTRCLRIDVPGGAAATKGRVNFVTIDSLSIGQDGEPSATLASTRYRALLPGRQLARRGYEVRVFPRPDEGWPIDAAVGFPEGVAVFSKSFSADNVTLARRLKERGDRIVVDICDNHFDHPQFGSHQRALCEVATEVVASTAEMAKVVEAATGRTARVVQDPVEGPRGTPAFAPRFPAVRVLWFGHPSNLDSLRDALPQLVRAAARYPMKLTLLTRQDAAADSIAALVNAAAPESLSACVVPWSEDATWNQLDQCDVVIIPSTMDDRRLVKSPNRLLEAIWAGRLAVAHPVPSYQAFADFCRITDDLAEGIAWAVEHQAVVLDRIRAGQDAIALDHSPWRVAADWELATQGNPAAEPIRLNLGCGDKILPGYINVDIAIARRGTRPDITCDLRRLAMFPDNYADEVLSVHVIEHFSRWEVEQVLAEWLRVLKPGGRMIIECPNLTSACQRFLDDPLAMGAADSTGRQTMWVFYGDPAWKDPLMNHRWGYSPGSLRELLLQVGLRGVRAEPARFKMREPRDMRLVGTKAHADYVESVDTEGPPAATDAPAALELRPAAGTASADTRPGTSRGTWDDYFLWFHETAVWKRMDWHGIRTLKFPGDMWNYQEIIFDERIDWVVETGTRHGGSALFFAAALAARQAAGRVISIDVDAGARQVGDDPRIVFMLGDSGSEETVAAVAAQLPSGRGPLFLILDSDHSKRHVLRELSAWTPLLRSGDYLVVEDTCVNGHPARPDHGPGPMEAIREWLGNDRSGKLQADETRSRKFGATAAPNGYFKIK